MNAGQGVAPGHKKTEMPCHGAGIDMAELRPETGLEELRSWIDMEELCTETGMEELRSGKARSGCTTGQARQPWSAGIGLTEARNVLNSGAL